MHSWHWMGQPYGELAESRRVMEPTLELVLFVRMSDMGMQYARDTVAVAAVAFAGRDDR